MAMALAATVVKQEGNACHHNEYATNRVEEITLHDIEVEEQGYQNQCQNGTYGDDFHGQDLV